jgi:hypothetical protein
MRMPESEAALRNYPSKERLARHKRERARPGWEASAHKRRQLAQPQKRRASQRELALKFPIRIVDREEFERLDFARRLSLGLNPNSRGTETLWQQYRADVRRLRVKGQGFLTTNGECSRALELAGRPRCEETVRRAHKALAEMGLLRRFHDRRGGSRPLNKDRLRVQFTPSFVTLPLAAQAASQSYAACAPKDSDCDRSAVRDHRPAAPARAAPPDGGRAGCAGEERQHRGTGPLSPEQEAERQLSFEAMWAQSRRRVEERRQ